MEWMVTPETFVATRAPAALKEKGILDKIVFRMALATTCVQRLLTLESSAARETMVILSFILL